jgi:hypothetical protein
MAKKMIFLLVCVGLFGAGCAGKTPSSNRVNLPLPVISIKEPSLHSTTTLAQVHLVGNTNMGQVWVGRSVHEVKDGQFDILLDLQAGNNTFPVFTGNGTVTSTMELVIERLATSTQPSIAAVGASKAPATKPTAKSAAPKTSAAVPAQVPVSFSSSEMKLTISLGIYGAQLSWSRAFEPFQSYVLVKSSTDSNVYFPKTFWFQAISNVDLRSFTDRDTKPGKTYYRVCKITPDQSVVCGNVASVNK